MWRAIFIFAFVAAIAAVLAWFADRPGSLTLTWLGYEIETSVMFGAGVVAAIVAFILFVWWLVKRILGVPGSITGFFRSRRRHKGYAALSQGMIALGAGDAHTASKLSAQADRLINDEPMTLLLKAQAAQLGGDEETANRVFHAMLQKRETEVLGLHGLFVQASRANDMAAARGYAERAMKMKSDLPWAAKALLTMQSVEGDWQGAMRTLETARTNGLMEKDEVNRQKAVLLTAEAMEIEDSEPDRALDLALDAHKLAPDLEQAAVIAGRILAAQGNTRKAARVVEKTWKLAPHPDLAEVYAHARAGDSPRDRLKRVKILAQKNTSSVESPIAIARAAVEAQDWKEARLALDPLTDEQRQSRVCILMAEIEDGESGDRGRVREWLARAVRAPRDPAWVADGHVSADWEPVSPVSGRLDAYVWKVPLEGIGYQAPANILEAVEHEIEQLEQMRHEDEPAAPILMAAAVEAVEPANDAVVVEEAEANATRGAADDADSADKAADTETGETEASDGAAADTSGEAGATSVAAGDSADATPETAEEEKTVTADEAAAVPEPKTDAEPDKDSGPVLAAADDDPGDDPAFVPPHAPDDPGPVPQKNGTRNWYD